MQPEVEARFLNVSHHKLRGALQAAGGFCARPMQAMQRVIIDYPDQRLQAGRQDYWEFVRVRHEGDRTVLTYKQIAKNEARDTHEIEVEVSSYEKTIALFEAIGLKVVSEQHTRREVWHFQGCEIALDAWPWLPSLVEVEGADEQSVQRAVELLGLSWGERIIGNVVDAYRLMYPGMTEAEGLNDIPRLTFDEMPGWLRDRQRKEKHAD